MKEYKMLFYVTCFLTMTTSEAQPTSSFQTPIIYTKQTSTPQVESPTESQQFKSPTHTTGPILSPTVILTTIAAPANQVVSTAKLPATSEKLTTEPVETPSTLQTEPPVMTDAPVNQVVLTAKLSATSKITYTELGTTATMQFTTKMKTNAPNVIANTQSPKQVVPTAASEKLTTKSDETKSANTFQMQLTTKPTSAQEVMTDTPDTTQVVPIAKVSATTKINFEKLTTKLVNTTNFRTQSSTIRPTSAQNIMTEKTTTQHAPTAKFSATTQYSETLTTKLADTTNFGTQSTTTRPTTTVQKTTSCEVCPPVILTWQTTEPPKFEKDHEKKAIIHGKIVAGIIAGSLLAMMVGFLVILYKKHKLQKHQIATTDWAGPTPFLESGGNNGHVTLRSANRISLTSFLPQRLSKRLSLLAESVEEMQELQNVVTPTTFIGKEEIKVENGPKVDKIDKSELDKTQKTEMDKTEKSEVDKIDKSAKETAESKSESSTKTDNVVLVDEKDKNGEIKNKESQSGQVKNETGTNEASENKPSEPATAENPSKEPNKETKEQTGKEGADNVV
ncbi:hypothetical protein NQD34_009943 [Periophthalmus magnuspinnatus]|nr:hypothetical protein NQD34_009943 [Periophthalmus magnuspinnatus]